LYLAASVGQHLAVLGGDQRGEFVNVRPHQLPEGEQDAGPLGQRTLRPAAESVGRRTDGVVDVAEFGQRHFSVLSPGRRVVHGPKRFAAPVVGLPPIQWSIIFMREFLSW
jgi:hypothetical protein